MSEQALTVRVNDTAIAEIGKNRDQLVQFITSHLVQGIDNDYAVIPGTKKKSLLKPGAEKIAQLFGLGSRIKSVDKVVDIHAGFAMFTYRIEVYHLKSGIAIAECEGSTNNLEPKYVNVPFGTVLNTLQKMAQKRAYVGAVIIATAASDYLTQDMEEVEDDRKARAKASVPKSKSAQAQDMNSAPQCCGRPMMISKFDATKWYCATCKSAMDREGAA